MDRNLWLSQVFLLLAEDCFILTANPAKFGVCSCVAGFTYPLEALLHHSAFGSFSKMEVIYSKEDAYQSQEVLTWLTALGISQQTTNLIDTFYSGFV